MVVYKPEKDLMEIQQADGSTWFHNKNMLRTATFDSNGPGLTPYERFLIAFQADGSFPSSMKGIDPSKPGYKNYHQLRFQFSKERKIERLIDICEEGRFEYSIRKEESRNKVTTIYVNIPMELSPTKSFEWVEPRGRTTNWCQEFIEEVSYWDATRRTASRFKVDTTDKDVSDVISETAMLAGFGCSTTVVTDDRKEHFKDTFTLSILTKNNQIGGQAIKQEKIDYEGVVYCLTVPSGKLLVRRNGCAVVSGNSGEPTEIVPQILGHLAKGFGHTVNEKGFKVLPDQVRVIQGDGIDYDSIHDILGVVLDAGFSADNIAFGSGGGLLQKVNRDTQRMAIKCSHAIINGEEVDVFKRPRTDPSKDSKRGRLALVNTHGGIETVPEVDASKYAGGNQLIEVFNNGEVTHNHLFADIRRRAELPELLALEEAAV